jgi:hypothetical protein
MKGPCRSSAQIRFRSFHNQSRSDKDSSAVTTYDPAHDHDPPACQRPFPWTQADLPRAIPNARRPPRVFDHVSLSRDRGVPSMPCWYVLEPGEA